MNVRIPLALACTASLFSLVQPTPALAQADQPTAASSGRLEEIIVTARRKEEKLQKVPVAVTALTGADVEKQHIESSSDLQHFVPSLMSSQQSR
jgi:iron complex outermembrane receptor protein